MSLNAKDKEVVKIFFTKIGGRGADVGAEALCRTLLVYPQTKTYFSHWSDLTITSPNVRKHGSVIFNAVMDAVSKMNDLKAGLLSLSELHAFMLRVDPANFRLFINNVHIVLAITFAGEYTPEIHTSVDKFLNRVALALSEKYR